MNALFPIRGSKRFCRHAIGTLLLTLPLSGIAFQLPPVQAQPAPVKVKPTFKPFPAEAKAKAEQFYALLHQEELCLTPLDFAVRDADLGGIIDKVKTALPAGTTIEVRQALPIGLTLDLKNTNVGDVLQATAGFMGSKLWVFSDHLVIAPKSKLTEAEADAIKMAQGGEWTQGTASGGQTWGASYLDVDVKKAIGARIQESLGNIDPATGQPPQKKMLAAKINFADLSPEIQVALQHLVDNTDNRTRLRHPNMPRMVLGPAATFRMDATEDGEVSMAVFPGTSQGGSISWKVFQ